MNFQFVTAGQRLLPAFLIVGAQRAGTTSLYDALTQHPDVLPAARKEIHFFDLHYHLGERWYRGHFPLKFYGRRGWLRGPARITGEASPYYLFHPQCPTRIQRLLPDVKLIIVLRNPADRAYSHYQHEVSLGAEPLSFAEAIGREADRIGEGWNRLLQDEHHLSFEHQHYSYLARGRYVEQLQRWFAMFPRSQILILKAEYFFGAPMKAFQEVSSFLGLPRAEVHIQRLNAERYEPLDAAMREQLGEYFRPYNHQLYDLLGVDFEWNGATL